MITLLFDDKLMRPACVLLQAVAGCAENNHFLELNFDANDWLVSPTPDMKRISGTEEQWLKLAKKLKSNKQSLQSKSGHDTV